MASPVVPGGGPPFRLGSTAPSSLATITVSPFSVPLMGLPVASSSPAGICDWSNW